MKKILAAATMVFATQSFANETAVKAEAMRLANVMLDNPAIVTKLHSENVNIVNYVVKENAGVNTFTIQVDRTCFCMPKPGTLTVTQDTRPTMADGPIKYGYELNWK